MPESHSYVYILCDLEGYSLKDVVGSCRCSFHYGCYPVMATRYWFNAFFFFLFSMMIFFVNFRYYSLSAGIPSITFAWFDEHFVSIICFQIFAGFCWFMLVYVDYFGWIINVYFNFYLFFFVVLARNPFQDWIGMFEQIHCFFALNKQNCWGLSWELHRGNHNKKQGIGSKYEEWQRRAGG